MLAGMTVHGLNLYSQLFQLYPERYGIILDSTLTYFTNKKLHGIGRRRFLCNVISNIPGKIFSIFNYACTFDQIKR